MAATNGDIAQDDSATTATMKDVAREAGVSIGTVDRVLHRRGRFSKATAEKVLEAARRLRFQPNLAASNLKRAQLHTILVILPHPEQDGGFWELVVTGINRAVQELANHYVRVRFAHYDRFVPESFAEIAAKITGDHEELAGLILAPTLQTASAALARRVTPIPVVVLDGELPGVELLCSISQESYEGGLLAAKLLHLMVGRGRFASVVVGKDDYHLLRRRAGFEDYFEGVATTERIEAVSDTQLREALRDRIFHEPSVDGLFVANAAAHVVVDTYRDSPKLSLPPILGYDLIAENEACLKSGSLSFAINQQPENQGYQAVYALYRHVVLNEPVENQIRIPVDLVTRETLQFHRTTTGSTKG